MAKKLPIFALLLCILPTFLYAATPRDPYQHFFEQTLGDLSEELEIARESGKQGVFVFFEMDECPFCHRMKQTVLNQPEVQDFFRQHFHSITIDIEGDIEIVDFDGQDTTQKEFARQNRVRATPLMAFYDLQGKRIFKYTGAASGVQEFIWMGEYIVNQVYLQKDDSGRNIRFTRFKQMKKKQTL
ncbi:MAG: thioredoxin fold domain-containing protein [Gammaproteobacteria bacterium]|nr:thioredoxin fold domain-containing protein [Gammaproteobacteria bacterium]